MNRDGYVYDPAQESDDIRFGIKMLASDDDVLIDCGVHILAEKGARAVPALIEAMGSSRFLISDNAKKALSWIGDPALIPLLHALNDDRPAVRKGAIRFLGKIEHERGDTSLSAAQMMLALSDEPSVAGEAAKSLGKIRYLPAVDHLIELLHHENGDLSDSSLEGLAFMKDARAITPLMGKLKEESNSERQEHLVAALLEISESVLSKDEPEIAAVTPLYYILKTRTDSDIESCIQLLKKAAQTGMVDLSELRAAFSGRLEWLRPLWKDWRWNDKTNTTGMKALMEAAAREYKEIARISAQSKKKIWLDGEMLSGEYPKPPSGYMKDGMFRSASTHQATNRLKRAGRIA